jgi:hypothetical protein
MFSGESTTASLMMKYSAVGGMMRVDQMCSMVLVRSLFECWEYVRFETIRKRMDEARALT